MRQVERPQNPGTPAHRLRETRERRGLTQAKLAALMGVTRPLIAQWETGFRHPSIETLQRLAKILDVSYEWLAFGNETLKRTDKRPDPESVLDPELLALAEGVVREVFAKKHLTTEGIGFFQMVAVMYAVALEQRATDIPFSRIREKVSEFAQRRIGA